MKMKQFDRYSICQTHVKDTTYYSCTCAKVRCDETEAVLYQFSFDFEQYDLKLHCFNQDEYFFKSNS
jgi:hypothetical protein